MFTNIYTFCDYLQISISDLNLSIEAIKSFPLRVPHSFATRIEKGNLSDPLLRQVLPVVDELHAYDSFSDDPVGDLNAVTQMGVLQKYYGRILLINTGACAIHCRYCFRRNFPYSELQLNKQQEKAAIQAIQNDPNIKEVILSGGDPLVLNDTRLSHLFEKLNLILTLKRIRIHTRLPIVDPVRVTNALLDIIQHSSKKIIVVVHCNHANEIDNDVAKACKKLQNAGATLLNQSVLLQGVNDDMMTLCELSERLFEVGIMPYYLHFLDKANGTGHFQVSKEKSLLLINSIRDYLPGYLVPKMVIEQAGQLSKQYLHDSVI